MGKRAQLQHRWPTRARSRLGRMTRAILRYFLARVRSERGNILIGSDF